MRAMPSPISSTRPTSRDSTSARYWLISCWRTETISSALNRMAAFLADLVPELLQTGADAGVIQPVIDLDNQAAQQVGIDARVQDRLAPEGRPQFLPQPLGLTVVQRHRRPHHDTHAARALVVQVLVGED